MPGGCTFCVADNRSKEKGTAIAVEGKTYPSLSKAAEHYKIKYGTVRKRLRNGKSIEEAFELANNPE